MARHGTSGPSLIDMPPCPSGVTQHDWALLVNARWNGCAAAVPGISAALRDNFEDLAHELSALAKLGRSLPPPPADAIALGDTDLRLLHQAGLIYAQHGRLVQTLGNEYEERA